MVGLGRFVVAVGGTLVLVGLVHRYLGDYPPPRRRSRETDRELPARRELAEVGVLVGCYLLLVVYAALAYRGLAPAPGFVALDGRTVNPAGIVGGVVLSVGGALALELHVHGRSPADLGVRWPRTWLPAVVLVGVGIGQGLSGLRTGGAVVSPVALAVGLYTPALEEELFFRGLVQSKLERATTPVRAWVTSGALFGLAHVPNDFLGVFWLAGGGDAAAAALFLARQTAFGLFVGVCYAKSRSLLAPVVAHYLTNDLADLLVTVADLAP